MTSCGYQILDGACSLNATFKGQLLNIEGNICQVKQLIDAVN